jgi:hypothetical protein
MSVRSQSPTPGHRPSMELGRGGQRCMQAPRTRRPRARQLCTTRATLRGIVCSCCLSPAAMGTIRNGYRVDRTHPAAAVTQVAFALSPFARQLGYLQLRLACGFSCSRESDGFLVFHALASLAERREGDGRECSA